MVTGPADGAGVRRIPASLKPTGVLIVRAWFDSGQQSVLLRVVTKPDITTDEEGSRVFSSVHEAIEFSSDWLEDFARKATAQ